MIRLGPFKRRGLPGYLKVRRSKRSKLKRHTQRIERFELADAREEVEVDASSDSDG